MSDSPAPPPPPADDRPPPPVGFEPPQVYGAPQDAVSLPWPLAPWWKRLVAALLDGFVLAFPTVVIFTILGAGFVAASGDGVEDMFGDGSFLAAATLSAIASLAYFGLLDGSERGQTLGKMALGIQVRDEGAGTSIGYARGFARHAMQTVAQFTSCLGVVFLVLDGLWPLWDPRRQALHDKVARTVVVDVRSEQVP